MTQDIMNLDGSTKQALHIAGISKSDLYFRQGRLSHPGEIKEVSFFKYTDGDVEISIEDVGGTNIFILTKEQVDTMLAWLNYSR